MTADGGLLLAQPHSHLLHNLLRRTNLHAQIAGALQQPHRFLVGQAPGDLGHKAFTLAVHWR